MRDKIFPLISKHKVVTKIIKALLYIEGGRNCVRKGSGLAILKNPGETGDMKGIYHR